MDNLKRYVIVCALAFVFAFIHYKYVSNIFENRNNFSHLSNLEREMVLRTEMGFYYSYYKTIVEEQPFNAGIAKLMYDKLVEYPKEVNAFNRFNIYPEVIIGTVYRYLEPLLNDTTNRDCFIVDRGEGHSMVESCTGIGQPIIFYLEAVWWLAGLTVGALFLHAVTLSGNIAGGVVSIIHYFANHTECTRVQWAPNERENMAMPLLLLQSWLLTMQLRDRNRRPVLALQISIFILNCLCLLFWQFTQFIFLAQMAIYFFMEQIRIIDVKALSVFLHSHFCGLHVAVFLLQGNDMLKTSLYTSFFLVVSVYCLFFSSLRINVRNKHDLALEIFLVITRIAVVMCISFGVKKLLSDFLAVHEDTHIWEILFSKITPYKTFHTLIYTCSDVFDYLPWTSIQAMLISLLIPTSLLNSYYFFISVLIESFQRLVRKTQASGQPKSAQSNSNSKESEMQSPEPNSREIRPGQNSEANKDEALGLDTIKPDPRTLEEINSKQTRQDEITLEETKSEINDWDESSLEPKKPERTSPDYKGLEELKPETERPEEIKLETTGSEIQGTEGIVSEKTELEPKECEKVKTELTDLSEARSERQLSGKLGLELSGSKEMTKETRLEQTVSEEIRPALTGSNLEGSVETKPLVGSECSRSNSSEADDTGIESSAESESKTNNTLNTTDVPAWLEKENPEEVFVKCFIIDPAIFYNIAQMLVFAMMAGLVMRLKLLFATQMCLIASLVTRKCHYSLPNVRKKYLPILWFIFTGPTLLSLIRNIKEESFHVGEFSDFQQEQLLQWINDEAGTGAFAGSMPILASVMLSTRKPIVVHPHYEHFETRQRAYAVYKMYGRFNSEELYQELSVLEASYLIVEYNYCYGRSNKNCSFGDIWDFEVPTLAHRPLLCHTLLTEPVEHFYPVFRNTQYAVFRVHDVSVRYMPRSFDT